MRIMRNYKVCIVRNYVCAAPHDVLGLCPPLDVHDHHYRLRRHHAGTPTGKFSSDDLERLLDRLLGECFQRVAFLELTEASQDA